MKLIRVTKCWGCGKRRKTKPYRVPKDGTFRLCRPCSYVYHD